MRLIEKVWFHQHRAKYWLVPLLLPLSVIFAVLTRLRRLLFRLKLLTAQKTALPVVVVGNIGIGGNGKTPLTIYLVEQCLQAGIKVGVISRGYGGKAPHYPYQVDRNSTAQLCGDEPYLIFNRCHVPVVVGADRMASAELLFQQGCELIIADDGLQHYRLARDIEIIVVDGKRQFGNGLLLPAGPLREGKWRLATADFVVTNNALATKASTTKAIAGINKQQSANMTLTARQVCNLATGERLTIDDFLMLHQSVHAIAGIGDPQRFFDTLQQHHFKLLSQQAFVDHHAFSEEDFADYQQQPLLMTEKDAVKCLPFALPTWWYLPVEASFDGDNITLLVDKIIKLVK